MDITPLIKLADRGVSNELKSYGLEQILPEEFIQALEQAQAQDRRQQAQEAAEQVIAVLKETDEAIETAVGHIRMARRQIAHQEHLLMKIHRAVAYGRKSGNFLPLVRLTRPSAISRLTVEDPSLFEVPADFQADEAPPKRHVAKKAAKAVRVR